MKRRILLSSIALCFAVLGAMAQRTYTFNAAALNVDGLPNQEISVLGLTTVNLNKDGKNEEGATMFCNYLANSNWDIVGLSEDFNFHSNVAAAPAGTYYNFGTHGGSINTNLSQAFSRAATDGLGIAVAKRFSFTPTGSDDKGAQTQWTTEYGGSGTTTVGDNGADNMITKGFRMYTVTLADGIAVDVYVLHMDAHTADSDDDYDDSGKDKNVVAREAQLKQLADYIIANHNNRPVIIIGDTNCRYTREQLKTGFIDYINADSRLTINDPWVDLMWGGTYPEYNTGSLMTHTYGQKGEVVDKIFYINTTESNLTLKANTYLWDESVNVSDHKPVVVNFTLTDPSGTPITDAWKEEHWQFEETEATFTKPSWQGEQVVDGTTYYVMNVGTGKYIKWGGWYNAQAVTGYAGHPITPTSNGEQYELVTRGSEGRSLGHGLFMDNTDHNTWTLTPVGGTSNHYYIENGSGALGVSDDQWQTLSIESKNTSDDTQKWIFLTEAGMRTAMADANPDYPFNFTPMLGAADFDVVDDWGGYAKEHWTNFEGNYTMGYVQWGAGQDQYNSSAAIISTPNAVTLSQDIEDLPAGNYKFSFEAFYNYILTTTTTTEKRSRSSWTKKWGEWTTTTSTSTSEKTMTAQVKIGSETIDLSANRSVNVGDLGAASIAFRDEDGYMATTYQTLSDGPLNISISKSATSSNSTGSTSESGGGTFDTSHTKTTPSYSYSNSVHFDNFRLEYRGTQTVAVDPYADYKKMVLEKVNETYPKVMALNAAGQAAYDITVVIERYNNDQITNGQIAQAMCNYVDHSYANALAAHKAFYVEQALENMEANGGDITGAIINPSFETGDLTGWTTAGGGWDIGVYENSNATFATTGCDGDYLFNSFGGDDGHTAHIEQTIMGVPNGLYELKVKVTSFSNRYVYITGNGYHAKVATTQDKGVFHEATLYFLVEDGVATIGAVGGNKGAGTDFIYYWPAEGSFFKADNFRLKYICDVPHGRLKLALNEAENANLDAYGKAALDISDYQTMFTNKSLEGNGKAEVEAVYEALQTAAKAQRTKNADMTWAIENPNFETGEYTGWTTTTGWDTGVKEQANGTYSVVGADGRYMFNTWNDFAGADLPGVNAPITQTVSGLPNGTYKVSAMVATDEGKSITLTANSVATTIEAHTKSIGVFPEVECEVTDGTLAIQVAGVESCWYKADNFRLTFVSPHLVLNETDKVMPEINDTYSKVTVNRTIKPNTWSTFVVPFDIPASMLSDWEIKELSSSTSNGDDIVLTFDDAQDGIKSGVPYMVRNTKMTENLTSLSMENIQVNTKLTTPETNDVQFVGTYTNGNVPVGAFFISGNKFYQAADNTNTINAFRAYFQPVGQGANARSLSYRVDGEDNNGETTAIEDVTEEVTVVGIYTLGGVRLNDMQEGVNILQMSNGSTIKVIIK